MVLITLDLPWHLIGPTNTTSRTGLLKRQHKNEAPIIYVLCISSRSPWAMYPTRTSRDRMEILVLNFVGDPRTPRIDSINNNTIN